MRMYCPILSGLMALLAWTAAVGTCASATTGPADGVASKPAPPDAAALEPATKTVNDVFRGEIVASRTPEARAELARKLIKTAQATHDDPASQYVLFTKAQELAAQSPSFDLGLKCVDEIEARWQVDGTKLRTDALARSARLIRDPKDAAAFVKAADGFIDDAVHGERFDEARRLCDAAVAPAHVSGDPTLAKDIAGRAKTVHDVQDAYLAAQPAMEWLKKSPKDPASNLAVGKYQCFAQGDWEAGLPKLAAGSDPVLQQLAKDELQPAADKAALADGWWDYGGTQAGLARTRARQRAAEWYKQATPALIGLVKLRAERRLAESAEAEMAGMIPGRTDHPRRPGVPEVVNHTEATEAQKIIDSVFGNYPELLKDVRTLELVKYHDGTQFHRNNGAPEHINDSYSATPVVGGGGGIWLWGIYEKWPPGEYLIVYRCQLLSEYNGANVCFCDVPKNGNTIASRRPASSEFKSGSWSEIPVRMDLHEPTTIEYRLWPNDHKMGMDRLYVFRLPGDDDRK
jgi:hypothetical protein